MYFFLSYITHHRFGVLLFAITNIEIKMMIVRVIKQSVHKKIVRISNFFWVQSEYMYRNMVKSDSFFFYKYHSFILWTRKPRAVKSNFKFSCLISAGLPCSWSQDKREGISKNVYLHIYPDRAHRKVEIHAIFPFESKSKLLVWNLFHSWHCIVFVIESKHQKVKKTISHNLT